MERPAPTIQRKRQQALRAYHANDLGTARQLLEQVCASAPDDCGSWLLLSAVYGQGGNFAGVIDCCNRVLAVEPHNGHAFHYLAGAHAALGHQPEALEAYQRAAALVPDDPVIRHNVGMALCRAGLPAEAETQLRDALRLAPNSAEVHYGLAGVLTALARYDEAKVHYQRATVLDPQMLDAHCQLGDLLANTGMPAEAVEYYRKALGYHPSAVELYYGLANALRYLGRLDEALRCYEEALRIRPDDPRGLSGAADIYERRDEPEEALRLVRSMVARGTADGGGADVYLRICRRYHCCDEAIALAERLFARGTLNEGMKRTLHHGLGKLYDKLGRYDEAFRHFEQGNALTHVAYDGAVYTDQVDSLIAAFCREAMANMARGSNLSQRPVFIVGMPRSGTSLVEQILASHPMVFGAGELNLIPSLVRSLPATLYPQCMESVTQETLDRLATQYLGRLREINPDADRVTDKMPGNFFHLGLIAIMLPGARVIHCMRDSLDTCLSIYFQVFNYSHSYATDLAHIGAYYKEYRRMMAHWQSVLDVPIFDVRYEELVADQERVSRELVAFCGLEWDARCLQFHTSERVVATASFDQVRKPVYRSSVRRWKNYERHLGPLLEALGDTAREVSEGV